MVAQELEQGRDFPFKTVEVRPGRADHMGTGLFARKGTNRFEVNRKAVSPCLTTFQDVTLASFFCVGSFNPLSPWFGTETYRTMPRCLEIDGFQSAQSLVWD